MSTAEDWIRWARAKAEAVNGPAHVKGNTPRMPYVRETPATDAAPLAQQQGNGEHADAFTERQGNAERWGTGGDEADPRRPGDPPWRGRIARRTSTPEAMAALRNARLRQGWSISRAAEETGVSRPHLSLLERGLRRPSESVAEDIIVGYGMTPLEADALSEIAVPWAGRDSPLRTGVAPGDW